LSDLDEELAGEDIEAKFPIKAKFRMRAHINPLNDTPWPFPINPNDVDWSLHFPKSYGKSTKENLDLYLNTEEFPISYVDRVNDDFNGSNGKTCTIADIGCGYGGLLFGLGKAFPEKLILGVEIRDKCVNFVGHKIRSLRQDSDHKDCNNISVLRQNCMRHGLNYFRKNSMEK